MRLREVDRAHANATDFGRGLGDRIRGLCGGLLARSDGAAEIARLRRVREPYVDRSLQSLSSSNVGFWRLADMPCINVHGRKVRLAEC